MEAWYRLGGSLASLSLDVDSICVMGSGDYGIVTVWDSYHLENGSLCTGNSFEKTFAIGAVGSVKREVKLLSGWLFSPNIVVSSFALYTFNGSYIARRS